MRVRFLRLLCLMLALSMLVACASAEATASNDDASDPEASESFFSERLDSTADTMFVINDTLFAQSWSEVYKRVENGWLRYNINSEGGSLIAAAADGNTIYVLLRRNEVYNEVTESWEMPEDGMYAILQATVDASGDIGAAEKVCAISWEVDEDGWPQFEGMQVQGDTAYLLLHDDDTNWDNLALYRIQLATGKGTKVSCNNVTGMVGYKDGLLLARYQKWDEAYDDKGRLVKMPDIVSIDPATGEITALAPMPNTNVGALVYDAATDSVYCADATYVYRYDSSFSAPETVGYLLGGTMGRTNMCATLFRDHYIVSDWSDENRLLASTVDPSLLPSRTLRVASGWYVDDVIRDYAKAHADVAIEYIDVNDSSAEGYRSHMQSPQAADIYGLSLPYSPYAPLLKHGLISDLSASEKLMETVSAMYPNLTDEYLVDGKLYGLPVSISASMMGYYPAVFEKAGLTEDDVPTTYGELMDFLADWYYDYYDDNPDITLFEWSPDLRYALFGMIFQTQVTSCQARGESITFRTPEIQQLLNRLDSQEMKTIFAELGPKRDASGANVVTVIEWSDQPTYLFSNYHDPMPSRYQSWMPAEPMPLSLNEGDNPVYDASLTLMVVNRASKNQDLAVDLLEYIADHLAVDLRTAMYPDVNDPIEVSYYQQNLAYFLEDIARYEAEIAKLEAEGGEDAENDIAFLREQMVWYEDRIERMEREERWAFTEEDIAYYREYIAPYLVVSSTSIFNGDNNPASDLIQMYVDGAKDANYFISEIDRIVRMMQEENR